MIEVDLSATPTATGDERAPPGVAGSPTRRGVVRTAILGVGPHDGLV